MDAVAERERVVDIERPRFGHTDDYPEAALRLRFADGSVRSIDRPDQTRIWELEHQQGQLGCALASDSGAEGPLVHDELNERWGEILERMGVRRRKRRACRRSPF